MVDVMLIGNPNTGKTTLFNSLTNSDEHVGNWHGVTVEEKSKEYTFNNEKFNLTDLPGVYSLTALSFEEEVVEKFFLEKGLNKKIVNICDESNLRRNLYLTLSLLECGCEMVVAINQIDKKPCYRVNLKKIANALGANVLEINANTKEGLKNLNSEILKAKKAREPRYVKELNLGEIKQIIFNFFPQEKLDFFAIKILERDDYVLSKLPQKTKEEIFKIIPENSVEIVAKKRYAFIDEIIKSCTKRNEKVYGRSCIDKFVMNRFLAFPIFACIFAIIFYLTFFSVGKWLSDVFVEILDFCVGKPILNFLIGILPEGSWIISLFENAIFGGVLTLFSFMPQIALLFLFLSVLEDSGYLSRVSFCFEDILSRIGLSGKSMYTLLMGFGCSATAVMTARTMEDKNAKIKTALLTPYMSCSAKFPIYALVGGVFFGAKNLLVIMGLYFLGVIIALSLSLLLGKKVLTSKQQSFILEFPPYRMPSLKRVGKVLYKNVRDFLVRIGSVLVSMNIVVWFLSNFSFTFQFVGSSGSMLEGIGKLFAPLFTPLGFGSWGAVSALICGVIAKEAILSSIILFNGAKMQNFGLTNPNSPVFFAGGANALSFLVYSLLYIPCISTMVVLKKEIGLKWTIIGIALQLIISFVCAFVVFNIFKMFDMFGINCVFYLVGALIVVLSFLYILKKIKSKKRCKSLCRGCDRCF